MTLPQNRKRGEPYLVPSAGRDTELLADWSVGKTAELPVAADLTLGDLGVTVEISTKEENAAEGQAQKTMPRSTLFLPLSNEQMTGIDVTTIRMFRCVGKSGLLRPVWDSGVNAEMGFAWAKVNRPGRYVPIGLPRDRLLQQILREIARARRLAGDDPNHEAWKAAIKRARAVLLAPPIEVVEELREFLTGLEVQTGRGAKWLKPHEIRFRQGLHLASFPLPKDQQPDAFRDRLSWVVERLEDFSDKLPEEELFYPPDPVPDVPWHRPGVQHPGDEIDLRRVERLRIWEYVDLSVILPFLFPQDWWMYQHDPRHTGAASGPSNIRSTTVSRMELNSIACVDGPIITKPVIVDGKIYVGSGRDSTIEGDGGTLYKIDLATGRIEGKFPAWEKPAYWMQGIGGSPAVVGGRVYFTGVHGKVYCLDTATMTDKEPYTAALWVTDLKRPSEVQNQPICQPYGDSWSSPLVINGRVYVGCGEGEKRDTYGFVFCLDAETGRVLWLFCTSKFKNRDKPEQKNEPNVIPATVAVSDPLPPWALAAGFRLHCDWDPVTRETGCSVWSSCAYDRVLNRIYVGTGNSQYRGARSGEVNGTVLPDEWYGSGLLSLDADTGQFRGFFQPDPDDSYRSIEGDVDVPGAPTIFSRGGQWVVAFGSKNGSFFLLDADMEKPQVVLQRRQLLPRKGGSGLPHAPGQPIDSVVPVSDPPKPYENIWGIFATPAVRSDTGKLFIGLGGHEGLNDKDKTPFMRALDWTTLEDAWPMAVGSDNISRYTAASPPLYETCEAGLSSPAVVNDIVFVSTTKTGLYALDVHEGTCLWAASGLEGNFALGPAVYGDYIVLGAGNKVYIYVLGPRWAHVRPDRFVVVPPASSPCQEPPWEGPDLRRLGKAYWKKET